MTDEKIYAELPCLICGKQLESAMGKHTTPGMNQPYDGTCFTTPGHYGSTVFDPMDNTYLEVNICDECLVTHKGRVGHRLAMKVVRTSGDLVLWDPDLRDHE